MAVPDDWYLYLVCPAALAAAAWVFFVLLPKTRSRIARATPADGIVEGFVWNDPLGLPKIRYQDAHGRNHEATALTGPKLVGKKHNKRLADESMRLEAGQHVAIRYDPDDPAWVMVENFPPPGEVYRLLGMVLSAMGLMSLAMILL